MEAFVSLAFTTLLLSCLSASPEATPPLRADAPTLRSVARLRVGAALNPRLIAQNGAYAQTAGREFSSVTTENHLKMHHVHPDRDRYDWSGADVVISFAERNQQRIHGHALVWHEAVPAWVKEFQGDSTAWEHLVRDHIRNVVTHYRGRIAAWDVVNEAFTDDGQPRQTIWREKLGPDYIARCFQYARQADPAVKLFYNDYGQEYSPRKLAAILTLANDLKRRGIPIDGVGLQLHTHVGQPDASIENALRQTAATGLLVHISELDVRVNQAAKPDFTPTDADWQRQAVKFAGIVRAYQTLVPPAQQHGITTWNVGDADSWIPNFCKCRDYPLPFDAQYRKKPAYDALLTALRSGR